MSFYSEHDPCVIVVGCGDYARVTATSSPQRSVEYVGFNNPPPVEVEVLLVLRVSDHNYVLKLVKDRLTAEMPEPRSGWWYKGVDKVLSIVKAEAARCPPDRKPDIKQPNPFYKGRIVECHKTHPNWSQRRVAEELHVSHGVVAKYWHCGKGG